MFILTITRKSYILLVCALCKVAQPNDVTTKKRTAEVDDAAESSICDEVDSEVKWSLNKLWHHTDVAGLFLPSHKKKTMSHSFKKLEKRINRRNKCKLYTIHPEPSLDLVYIWGKFWILSPRTSFVPNQLQLVPWSDGTWVQPATFWLRRFTRPVWRQDVFSCDWLIQATKNTLVRLQLRYLNVPF